jgi:hypothetical protein
LQNPRTSSSSGNSNQKPGF